MKTALAESLGTQQLYGIALAARLPLTIVAVDCRLRKVLDLTAETILHKLHITREKLQRCRWRESMEKGRESLTHAMGRIAFEQTLEGLVVPSARVRKGKNLIVFPQNLQKGSSLSIQNVEKLLQKNPS
jgi:RES domain-containing protein